MNAVESRDSTAPFIRRMKAGGCPPLVWQRHERAPDSDEARPIAQIVRALSARGSNSRRAMGMGSDSRGEIKEAEMAFGVLREGPSSSSLERWMHLRCVDGKLRMRALTEGLRGWGAMEAGQRQEVLRRMSE